MPSNYDGQQQPNPQVDMEWDVNAPQQGTVYQVLPTDIYVMKVTESYVEENTRYGQPDRNGEYPKQLVLKWTTERVTPEQAEAGIAMGETVYERINPWYGDTANGAPSKFKQRIDMWREQGHIGERFRPGDFVGIINRVAIEEYIKSQGPNAGSPGNKVTSVAPLQVTRRGAGRPGTGGPGAVPSSPPPTGAEPSGPSQAGVPRGNGPNRSGSAQSGARTSAQQPTTVSVAEAFDESFGSDVQTDDPAFPF